MKSRFCILLTTALVALGLSYGIRLWYEGTLPSSLAPERSTFSTKKQGLKALYLIAQRLHPETRRWMVPFQVLEGKEPGTLVACNPSLELSDKEKVNLDRWLDRGGRLILLVDRDWLEQHEEDAPKMPSKRVQIWEVADCLSNGGLSEDSQACITWIQRLVQFPGPLYFDEYHHGVAHRRSMASLTWHFLHHPVGVASLHLALTLMLLLFGFRLRINRHRQESDHLEEFVDDRSRLESLEAFIRHVNAPEFTQTLMDKYLIKRGDSKWKP